VRFSKGNFLYLQWTVAAIAILFPAIFLTVPRAGNASFYLLALCSLIGIGCRLEPMGKSFSQLVREYWPVNLAMSGLVFAILIHQLSSGRFLPNMFEMPLQLACFALLFWILLLLPADRLKNVQWGLVAGSLLCTGAIYIQTAAGAERPLHVLNVPLIPFGQLAMLMGILALLSTGWNERNEKIAVALKMLAGGAALYGSYLTQTRGGWIALPIFVAIAFAVFRNIHRRFKLSLLLIALALLCGSYILGGTVQRRVVEAASDVRQYADGSNKNTSVGLRLQLWHGAWILFKENPVFGIGRERYPEAVRQLVQRQVISPDAAAHPHSHNEVLFHMATLGIVGLLALLSLYFVPAFYFFRDLRNPDRETRTIAGMGLALSLGFFVFGLTDVMFYWRVSYLFYAILLSVLFACLVKRKSLVNNQG
jgi:O-antigen ligase